MIDVEYRSFVRGELDDTVLAVGHNSMMGP